MHVEELNIPAMTPIQQLGALQSQIKDFDEQIDAMEQVYGISLLREQRAARQAEYESLKNEIAPGLPYSEDTFLKAINKKGDSYREGGFKMIRTSRTVRNVLTEKFVEAFPDLLKSVCKIELTKADALVGKTTMERYTERKTTYSYELINMGRM